MRRRDLASLLLPALPVLTAQAQPPAPATAVPAPESAPWARVRAVSAELSNYAVPIAVEPAVHFRAY